MFPKKGALACVKTNSKIETLIMKVLIEQIRKPILR